MRPHAGPELISNAIHNNNSELKGSPKSYPCPCRRHSWNVSCRNVNDRGTTRMLALLAARALLPNVRGFECSTTPEEVCAIRVRELSGMMGYGVDALGAGGTDEFGFRCSLRTSSSETERIY